MRHGKAGFSMVELLIVIVIMGIIAVFAIPGATHAVYNYRIHSDAGRLAAQLNIARYRATSQYSPYSLTLNSGTIPNTMTMERLCGSHTPTTDCGAKGGTFGSCTVASQSYTSYAKEGGAQYISQTDSFSPPSSVPSVLPGSITSASAATTTFFFNTRGMPVDCNGLPVANGGAMAYITSTQVAVTDAVVVSVAGLVSTYQWDPGSSQWIRR